MEFNEKLQNLRKNKGLTQEELAEALFVSRTAVSKWESGRGYPSIDSLKELSKFFSVTIDELLSGEKLLAIAEKEEKTNIQNIRRLLLGIMDICSCLLIILPLYPNTINGHIYSVSLFMYSEAAQMKRYVYWVMFLLMIVTGMTELIWKKERFEKSSKIITDISMSFHILLIIILALSRESYAIILSFLLLVAKGMLLIYTNPS